MSATAPVPATGSSPGKHIVFAGGAAGLVAGIVNSALAAGAVALFDIPEEFLQLQPGAPFILSVLGVLLGAAILVALVKRNSEPRPAFLKAVAILLPVSFLPDLGLLLGDAPGVTGPAVVSLMVLHVVAAAIAVPWLLRALPAATD